VLNEKHFPLMQKMNKAAKTFYDRKQILEKEK
jgi:hypothetical protein